MGNLSAYLEAGFACEETAGRRNPLELEHVHTLRQGKDGTVDVFKLFPAVPADLYPSMGTVVFPATQYKQPVVELVRFNGGRRAGLKYPRSWYGSQHSAWWTQTGSGCAADDHEDGYGWNHGGVSREIVQAYDPVTGYEIRPSISHDSDANELVASRPMVGIVRATYEASYRVVSLYRGGDQIRASGNLVAMYRGAQDDASFGGVAPEQPIPVYEVVSEYLADESGAWEVPPNWPDENIYPIRSSEPLPNQDSYQQLERVHERCVLDTDGTMRFETFRVPIEEPYTGQDWQYHPKYRFEPGDSPEADSEWSEAWANVNWASIYADVRARYPGIEI